ncbi:MAG: alpha/beta fold hydrolase [Bacteroidota bacterium]|nr:alpha/beta fold hydrolase [Bacteroidota bacterium]
MKLFYRRFGEGRPLIILHGLFGLSDNWFSIGKLLAQNYCVVIPDLRNHGQSPHSSIFDYAAMSDDISELMDDLGFQSATLIGHSMGGKVVMQFALTHPERTDGLIVVDMSMRQYYDQHIQTDIMDAMMAIDFEQVDSRNAVSGLLKHSIPDEKVRLFIMKNLYRKTRTHLGWRPDLEDIYQNIDHVFESLSAGNAYEGASLFISGAASDYILDSDVPQLLHYFPKAIFRVVTDAGHWVHADNPDGFLKEVTAFLNKNL